MLLLVTWTGAQVWIVPPPYAALPIAWIAMLALLLLLHQAGRAAAGTAAVTMFAWIVLLSTSTLALQVIWELFVSLRNMEGLPRQLSGWVGQPNHLATLLLMGVVSAGTIAAGRCRRAWKLVALILALPMGAALPLTGSRTGLVNGAALVLLGGLTWFLAHHGERVTTRRKALWLGIGGALLVGLFFLEPVLLSRLADTKVSGVEDRVGQAGLAANSALRTDEWRKSWRMLQSHPLGVGGGQYGAYSYQLQRMPPFVGTPKETVYSHSHNLVTQVGAELGWPGLLILLGGVGVWLFRQLRQPVTLQRAYAWSILLVIFIHSMLEYPLWYAYFLAPFAFALGLADEEGRKSTVPLLLWRTGMVVTGLIAFAVIGVAVYGTRAVDRGYEQWTAGHIADARKSAHEAVSSVLYAPDGEQLLNYLDDAEPQGLAEKLDRNDRLIHWRPYGSIVYRQTILLAQAGRLEEAKHWLADGLTVYPSKRHYYNDLYARTRPNARLQALDQEYQGLLKAKGLPRNIESED